MDYEFAKLIIDTIQLIFIAIAGVFSLKIFLRDRALKTADTLLALEEEYRKHIPLLLDIENIESYKSRFSSVIEKTNKMYEQRKIDKTYNASITKDEREAFQELDSFLRHLLICAQIRQSGIDKKIFDNSYRYYLLIIMDSASRPGLSDYIKNYWNTIYRWAQSI